MPKLALVKTSQDATVAAGAVIQFNNALTNLEKCVSGGMSRPATPGQVAVQVMTPAEFQAAIGPEAVSVIAAHIAVRDSATV